MADDEGPRQTLTPGTRVAHFRVVRELGRGGYGIVHLAEDLEIPGRVVAVKTVRPGPVMPDAESLRHEASVLAALQHPAILVVHEVGEGPSGIFLAAEFMPGGSVSDRLARGPLSEAEALALSRAAADALAAAHEAGLVHRDFKPGNLLLSADGLAKVADFGIATRETKADATTVPLPEPSGPMDATLTATIVDGQLIVGTPAYMPPELFSGVAWSPRGDQFSFGIVLHEMLTRAHPFDLRQGIVATRLEPSLSPSLPLDLKRIVARCLARDPAARYPDMRAVVAALDEAILRRSPERQRTWRVAIAGGGLVLLLVATWGAWRAIQTRRAHTLNEQGRAALGREAPDRDTARAAFVAAHSAAPWYLPACQNLGQLAAEESNPTWAVTILRDCATAFPDSAPIRYNLGAALARSSDLAAGERELNQALKGADSELHPFVVNELAQVYIATGRSAEAIRLIEAEHPDPGSSIKAALLTRTLGLALLETGRAEDAERAFNAALPGVPAAERPATLVALGKAQEARGLEEDAVKSYSQALVEGATGETEAAARAGLARIVPS